MELTDFDVVINNRHKEVHSATSEVLKQRVEECHAVFKEYPHLKDKFSAEYAILHKYDDLRRGGFV